MKTFDKFISEGLKLDPTIKKISEHFKFDIKYDKDINRFIISNGNKDKDFYWSSANGNDLSDFLDELKYHYRNND